MQHVIFRLGFGVPKYADAEYVVYDSLNSV